MRRIFAILMALTLCCALIFCVGAASSGKLVDQADILTESEEKELLKHLDEISKEHKLDVMIVALDGTPSNDIDDLAEQYYLSADLGEDGIVLLIDMQERDWTWVLFGKSDKKFGDKQEEELENAFASKLSEGAYFKAFNAFADTYVEIMESSSFSVMTIVLSIAAGALLSFLIPMSILKGELKSVRMQAAASSYVKPNSMKLRAKRDIFLYRNVTRTAKPKNNSSGGRSGSTSGGRSSRSGKF